MENRPNAKEIFCQQSTLSCRSRMRYAQQMASHFFARTGSSATKTFALAAEPPVFVRGQGARLFDAAGHGWTDLASGSSANLLGYGHPAITAAIGAQAATGLVHVGPHFHAAPQQAFIERVLSLAPPHLTRVHPATNGTEATEVALKAAIHATGGRRFVAFEGGYHGRSLGALHISSTAGTRALMAPLLPPATFLPYPGEADGEAACDAAIAALDALSAEGPLAGIVIEAVQGTGGAVVPPSRFLAAVGRAARRLRVPLILDEVFTAFGRTGAWFAFTAAGLEPDLVVLAKGLGGGGPCGLVLGREDLLGRWPAGLQSSTFQLSPLAAAAGLAVLDVIATEGLLGRAQEIGAWTRAAGFPSLSGVGALHAVAVCDPATGAPDAARARSIRALALRSGVVTYECGRAGHAIGILPPLVISYAELQAALEVLATAFQAAN